MSNYWRKFNLYILSLAILFVFIIILSVQLPNDYSKYQCFQCWKALLSRNILPIICMLLLAYCSLAYYIFNIDLKGSENIPFKIQEIEDINYEHLIFLATYVIPLISFDLENLRQIIILILLLVIMGAIYVKTNLFYANPSLALLGFKIYKVEGNFKGNVNKTITVISKNKLTKEMRVSYIKLDETIYYVREL